MTHTLRSLAQADLGIRAPKLERTGPRNRLRDFAKSAMPTFDGPIFGALIFSAKTFAAALLALFISFWLGLDEPYWAVMAVFIVAQPDSGLVLAKGFYRLWGTAVGLLVTTALVFTLAQYGELFIAALAVWIGACAFAARGRRNFAAYSFALAGYTAAIVGVPAALNPDAAYTLIVARGTEITLGIVCMGLVSRLVFPSDLAPKLTALAGQLCQHVDRFAQLATDPRTKPERLASERAALAKDFGALETMRASAFFESAEARLIDSTLRDAVHAAVDLCAIAEAVAAHHGPESGAVKPKTPEAIMLHHIDMMSAHLDVCRRAYEEAKKTGAQAEYSKMLGVRPFVPGFFPQDRSEYPRRRESDMMDIEKSELEGEGTGKLPWE